MADTIPSDAVSAGDSGHIQDHINIADMLGLLTQFLAQFNATFSAVNATNIGAVQTMVTAAFVPTTYTPTVSGGGSATFTTRTGWYFRFGKMIYFCAYIVVNAAGSGTSNVQITAPTSLSRATGQMVPMICDAMVSTTDQQLGVALADTSGSGATFDRLRRDSDGATNKLSGLLGQDLLAGGKLTVQGWYREV